MLQGALIYSEIENLNIFLGEKMHKTLKGCAM